MLLNPSNGDPETGAIDASSSLSSEAANKSNLYHVETINVLVYYSYMKAALHRISKYCFLPAK